MEDVVKDLGLREEDWSRIFEGWWMISVQSAEKKKDPVEGSEPILANPQGIRTESAQNLNPCQISSINPENKHLKVS